ncbi:MAG: DUF2779 domain-containing protein [Candidatus Wallbacteria bacterium]|nr:DUF2779 domain-containing protein [Candidatus Wallbacteria bacterium]
MELLELTKTLIRDGISCPKYLYLYKHCHNYWHTVPSRAQRLQEGLEAKTFARKMFKGGVEVPLDVPMDVRLRLTTALVNRGATVFGGAFESDGITVVTDILKRQRGKTELYEVKSAGEIKGSYYNDLAIQLHVMSGCGIRIDSAYLVHMNKEYVRHGNLDCRELFTLVNLTGEARRKTRYISNRIRELRLILQGGMPEIGIGEHCGELDECEFYRYCWADVPEDSVFTLRDKGANKYELYRSGIRKLSQIPVELLGDRQKMQVSLHASRGEYIQVENLRKFIRSLWYPLYFLDFETMSGPIPLFDGTSPHQRIPFQYSLHGIVREGAEPSHHEYLAEPDQDPRAGLLESLLSALPDGACVLSYNKSSEIQVLKGLGFDFPKHKKRVARINASMRDLMDPFKNRDYYHWKMMGGLSLKSILPALVDDLSYSGLKIADGMAAADAYQRMRRAGPEELSQIRRDLLDYCKIDSLALLRIWEKLKKIADSGTNRPIDMKNDVG